MIWLIEMLIPAAVLGALATVALLALPNAPPRLRFAVAVAGLGAWLVPWPLLRVSFDPASALGARLRPSLEALSPTAWLPADSATTAPPYALAIAGALTLLGVALFLGDCLALRRTLKRWRSSSHSDDSLRALLPDELRRVPAEIRVVRGTRVAATSGWTRPIVWVGDGYRGTDLKLVLMHEFAHVRAADPVWMALVTAVRRAYWWNPLVRYLSRQALLTIEASCDRRCAEWFGKSAYLTRLATMMLELESSRWPNLVATLRGATLNVQRLRLLDAPSRCGARDYGVLALLMAGAAITAGCQVIAPASGAQAAGVDRGAVAATPASVALGALVAAVNDGDAEGLRDLLGAYTPQEVALPFGASGSVELLEAVSDEPSRVVYLVRDLGSSGLQRGVLEVAADSALVSRTWKETER